jgi:hypothetical protein
VFEVRFHIWGLVCNLFIVVVSRFALYPNEAWTGTGVGELEAEAMLWGRSGALLDELCAEKLVALRIGYLALFRAVVDALTPVAT